MTDGIEQKCFKIPFDALLNVMFCNVTLTIEIESNQKNSNFDFKSKFAISSGFTYSYPISAFRLQLSPVVPTCAHPRAWTDFCTSYEPRQRHWVHEGSTSLRLPCGTRSRWTCVIPDSRSTPSEQNWNLTFSWLIDFFRFSFMYFIILFSFFFFAVRVNVMFISWRVQMSELNWIEFRGCAKIVIARALWTSRYWASFEITSIIKSETVIIYSKMLLTDIVGQSDQPLMKRWWVTWPRVIDCGPRTSHV